VLAGVFLSISVLAAQVTEQPSVLVLDLDAARIEASEAKVINDLVGQSVARKPVKVTTAADVRRMADVESQKALLGCETDASCLADLAGDFGARYVLYGSVAALGELYVVQLTLFDAEKAEAVDRVRVETRELSEVTHEIDEAVDRVFTRVVGGPAEAAAEPVPASAWIMAGGATVTAVGAILLGVSAIPAGQHNGLQVRLGELESEFDENNDTALVEAADVQARASEAALNHLLLLGSGAALTVVGIGVVATGLMMGDAE
jgi:hypothetical protein